MDDDRKEENQADIDHVQPGKQHSEHVEERWEEKT